MWANARKCAMQIDRAWEERRVIILDGGLATELQARGHNISDRLWSARILLSQPEAIEQLHFDYYAAGADCVITSSYQATIPGFVATGLTPDDAAGALRSSVRMAQSARRRILTDSNFAGRALAPMIAASIGPYGAYLHDGSEYRGDYNLSREELVRFHCDRVAILAECGADLFAFETIPCLAEAQALRSVLHEHPQSVAWFSFSCRDERHVANGEPISNCARMLDQEDQVAAIGVNCTAPQLVEPLIGALRGATGKPIVVYPNSGEAWDAAAVRWTGPHDSPAAFADLACRWRDAGATLIGGCCRTGPEHIREIAERLNARN